MNIKHDVIASEKTFGTNLDNLATRLLLYPQTASLETNKDTIRIKASLFRLGNYKVESTNIQWKIESGDGDLVKLQPLADGSCLVIPSNTTDETRQVIVTAYTSEGLEAACLLVVSPEYMEAPAFTQKPKLKLKKGELQLTYILNTSYPDESIVKWYCCTDKSGNHRIETAISQTNKPLKEYETGIGDEGYYIMVSVEPKHKRCHAGNPASVISKNKISRKDLAISGNQINTDFRNNSTQNQPCITPGFYTLTHFPEGEATDTTLNAWYYGKGKDGAINEQGLLPTSRSASLYYTPVGKSFGDMKCQLIVAPFKTDGQGFSVAGLYMDILIKFDATTKSGYGFRFIRTTKYGNAVDCFFVKYQNGNVSPITSQVAISCFRTPCFIKFEYNGGILSAHVSTTSSYIKDYPPEILPELNLSTQTEKLNFGGFGIHFNGGSAVLIKEVTVDWKE